jgi:hypothetical protein
MHLGFLQLYYFLSRFPHGLGNNRVFAFCVGDIDEVGFPFIQVFLNATGSVSATTGMTVESEHWMKVRERRAHLCQEVGERKTLVSGK